MSKRNTLLRLLAFLLMAGIFAIDIHVPTGYSASLLYVGVVLLGLPAPNTRLSIEAAVICTALAVVGHTLAPSGGDAAMGYFNLGVSLLLLWATAIGVVKFQNSAADQRAGRNRGEQYLNVVSVAVRVLDPAGRIVLMNRRGLELLGRSESEVVGHAWEEFIRPEDLPAWREALKGLEAPTQGEVARTSHSSHLLTPDGRSPVVHWSNVALHDERGQYVGILSSGEEITGRLAAEDALRKSVKDLQDLKFALDQSAIVATTNVRGDILYVNDTFCTISKYRRDELLGQNHRILNSGLHPTEFFRQMYSTIGQGRVWRGEIRNRAKDGALYWVDTTVVPLLDERGHPAQYIAIRYDITERKASEAALREQAALAQLGKMAAVVAHEVRNPLAGIRGALQVIGRRLPDGSRERSIVGEIISRIDTLNTIVQDLLQFARPRQPVLVDVRLADLVRETATLLQEDPGMANLRIQVETAGAVVMADREQLKLALLNLLMNSAQAMHGEGIIHISARQVDGAVELRILDEGPGIAADVREHLFEPFFTTKHRGTGLGLATSRRIFEAHGGTIELECPPGGGTIAVLRLPAATN